MTFSTNHHVIFNCWDFVEFKSLQSTLKKSISQRKFTTWVSSKTISIYCEIHQINENWPWWQIQELESKHPAVNLKARDDIITKTMCEHLRRPKWQANVIGCEVYPLTSVVSLRFDACLWITISSASGNNSLSDSNFTSSVRFLTIKTLSVQNSEKLEMTQLLMQLKFVQKQWSVHGITKWLNNVMVRGQRLPAQHHRNFIGRVNFLTQHSK